TATPRDIVNRLSSAIATIARSAAMRERLTSLGAEAVAARRKNSLRSSPETSRNGLHWPNRSASRSIDDASVRKLRFAPDQDDRRRDQSGDRGQRAAALAAPRLSADTRDVAQDRTALGAAVHGRLSRSARLWRLRKARGRQVA